MTDAPTRCLSCEQEMWFRFATMGRVKVGAAPEILPFYQCAGCGLTRLQEDKCLTDDDYESGRYRESTGEDPASPEFEEAHKRQGESMASHLRLPPGESVVDIGAGGGYVLEALREGRDVLGIEPNDDARARMGRQRLSNWPSVDEYVEECDKDDSPRHYDHVLCIVTLEHVPSPWATFDGAMKLMHEDSQFHVVVPILNLDRAWLDFHYTAQFFCVQHRWYYTVQSLQAIFTAKGLVVSREPEIWTRPDGYQYLYMSGHRP